MRAPGHPRQGSGQLELLAGEEPDPPQLECELVYEVRAALQKLGCLTWSGRVAVIDRVRALEEVRPLREAWDRGEPLSEEDKERVIVASVATGVPFLPALGKGTPDVLGILPDRTGRLFGFECKRTARDKERPGQRRWHDVARLFGVRVATVRSPEEAVAFLEAWKKER